MKKFIGVCILLSSIVWAGGWNNDINTARSFAKNRGQVLMIFVESQHCKWCTKMKTHTFNNTKVLPVFNTITRLKINESNSKLLRALPPISGVPVLFFIDPSDKQILLKASGYRNVDNFLDIVSMAQKKYNQKYKIR